MLVYCCVLIPNKPIALCCVSVYVFIQFSVQEYRQYGNLWLIFSVPDKSFFRFVSHIYLPFKFSFEFQNQRFI